MSDPLAILGLVAGVLVVAAIAFRVYRVRVRKKAEENPREDIYPMF